MAWIIPLGKDGRYETIVSDEDYAYLKQWKWSFKISDRQHGTRIYARRGGGRPRGAGGSRNHPAPADPTILMHDVVCEREHGPRPTEAHTADHKNRQTLDNQRHNLEWATPKQQRSNQNKAKRWFNRKQKEV